MVISNCTQFYIGDYMYKETILLEKPGGQIDITCTDAYYKLAIIEVVDVDTIDVACMCMTRDELSQLICRLEIELAREET